MPKIFISVLLAFLIAGPAWPQEEPSATDADEPQDSVQASADDAGEIDDSDLDEQSYDEDEDEFVPTEEIPADEPIPFPSNI